MQSEKNSEEQTEQTEQTENLSAIHDEQERTTIELSGK